MDGQSTKRRSFISKLIGDRGHRTEGIVTLVFVAFLVAGLLGFFH